MNRHALASLLGILALASLSGMARGQLTFSNLLETRLGNDPSDVRPDVSDNRFTLFEQFHVDSNWDALQLGLRYEIFQASEDEALDLSALVQRYAAWHGRPLSARVGNFHALFGRGLVLRSFELPGVVREEQFRQFGDTRDLDGARVDVRHGGIELLALAGKPRRANDLPGSDRQGLVSGGQVQGPVLRGLRLGGEYLRLDAQDGRSPAEVPGAFVQLNMDPWLQRAGVEALSLGSYVEVARASGLDPATAISPHVDPDAGRGLYVAADVAVDDFGPGLRAAASWEYKDYQNLLLMGGVNQPPTLVREHTYTLLNRSTHVLEPEQEEGYQLETRFGWRRRADLTLNWSRAENQGLRRFREFYAELAGHLRGGTVSLFGGTAEDGSAIPPVYDREALGVYTSMPLVGDHSLQVEIARLQGVRDLSTGDVAFEDRFLSLTWAWVERLTFAATWTSTDDPGDPSATDPDPRTGVYARQQFTSLAARFRIGEHHELLGFWGERRGGIACTAGTCYLVPPFDGVSLRLLSRF